MPSPHFARGCYFALQGQRSPFTRLVYPVPDPTGAGLGVHATVDLGGLTRFGPNVEWLDELSADAGCGQGELAAERAAVERAYEVDPAGADGFYAAVRRYWPALQDGALAADYAGIRPKLSRAVEDFRIVTAAQHGVRGLVHLFGVESPGLTSSLALADVVAQELLGEGS